MMKKNQGTVIAMMVLLFAFATSEVVRASQIETYFVRATSYHKSDPGCDPWTLRGQTSTRLRLPSEAKINCHLSIGNVALDPRQVPEGSLVYETQTGRLFVATTGGTAVIRRDAAISLARRQGKPEKYKEALVFDFYARREIVENHFTYCLVIRYDGEIPFRNLQKEYQEQRLDPKFWIPVVEAVLANSSNEERENAETILLKLREIAN